MRKLPITKKGGGLWARLAAFAVVLMMTTAQMNAQVAKIIETDVQYPSISAAINAATTGQTVQMIANSNENVTVANDKTLTLDLNGMVLKGNGLGFVITNNGTLTLEDSNKEAVHKFSQVEDSLYWELNEQYGNIIVNGGCITTIQEPGVCGGINNRGILTMNSGNIVGNRTDGNGAGVCTGTGTESSCAFTMNGGSILGNSSVNNGGGVGVNGYCVVKLLGGNIKYNIGMHGGGVGCGSDTGTNTLTLGGDIVITDNIKYLSENSNNLYVNKGHSITVGTGAEAPQPGMSIGVTTASTNDIVPVTTFSIADYSSFFTSDNEAYYVKHIITSDSDHRVALVKGGYTLTEYIELDCKQYENFKLPYYLPSATTAYSWEITLSDIAKNANSRGSFMGIYDHSGKRSGYYFSENAFEGGKSFFQVCIGNNHIGKKFFLFDQPKNTIHADYTSTGSGGTYSTYDKLGLVASKETPSAGNWYGSYAYGSTNVFGITSCATYGTISSSSEFLSMKLYDVRIWEGTTPKIDAITVSKNNVAGLYDMVTGQFIETVHYDNLYTMTFDQQDATTLGTLSIKVATNMPMTNITVPEKTGYAFDGYYTQTDGQGKKYFNFDGTPACNYDLTSDTTVFASWKAPVAKIGEKGYASVQNAMTAATTGDTILLVSNSTENMTIASGKTITLDLNGKVLSATSGDVITNNGTLTLTDNSTDKNGSITGATTGTGVVNNGTFNMSVGTIIGNATGVLQNGTMTVGGTAIITGNTTSNLKIAEGKVITVDTPASGMNVGITPYKWESGSSITLTTDNAGDYSQYFKSDNEAEHFVVFTDKEDGNKLKITDVVKIIIAAEPFDAATVEIYDASTGEPIADPEHIRYGTEVTIKVTTVESGWTFNGWYNKSTSMLFSGKQECTFKAIKNLELEARFTDEVIWIKVKK